MDGQFISIEDIITADWGNFQYRYVEFDKVELQGHFTYEMSQAKTRPLSHRFQPSKMISNKCSIRLWAESQPVFGVAKTKHRGISLLSLRSISRASIHKFLHRILQGKDSFWSLRIPPYGTSKPECTGNNCRGVNDVYLSDVSTLHYTWTLTGPECRHTAWMIAPVTLAFAAVIGQNNDQAFIKNSRICDSINHQSNQRVSDRDLLKIGLRSEPVRMASGIDIVELHKEHIGRAIPDVSRGIRHKFRVWRRDAVASTGLLDDSRIDRFPATERH